MHNDSPDDTRVRQFSPDEFLRYIEHRAPATRPFLSGRVQHAIPRVIPALTVRQQAHLYALCRPDPHHPLRVRQSNHAGPAYHDQAIPLLSVDLPRANLCWWRQHVLDSRLKLAIKDDLMRAMTALAQLLHTSKATLVTFTDHGTPEFFIDGATRQDFAGLCKHLIAHNQQVRHPPSPRPARLPGKPPTSRLPSHTTWQAPP